jgi:hypothetical protein
MPRALVASFAIALTLFAPPVHAGADVTCDVTIPVTMVDTMDSGHSYPGERFRFKTTARATYGDIEIAPGTEGWGVVRYVQGARAHNRGGLIVIEPRFITVGETHISVMSDPRETAEFAHSLTLMEQGMGYAPLGIFGTAINLARAGSNVTLGPGFNFHVVVLGDIIAREPCHPIPHATTTPVEERRQSSPSPSPSTAPVAR